MNWRFLTLFLTCISSVNAQTTCDSDRTAPDLKLYSGIATIALDQDSSIRIYAKDFDAGTIDDCTPATDLIFSFSENPSDTEQSISCADAGMTVLTIFVQDASGNRTSGTVAVHITGIQCPQVLHEVGLLINLMNFKTNYPTAVGTPALKLSVGAGSNSIPVPDTYYSVERAGSGIYVTFTPKFYTVYAGKSVSVSLIDLDLDIINGVSTLDVLAIQKHILGIQKFSNNYYTEAADINGDGKISAIDIIELRRVVLGILDTWRFVPNWRYDFLSEPSIMVEELHQKTINCFAVKTGDVN